MESSDALEREIRTRAVELEKYCEDITRCRVVVESPSSHHRQGQHYHVRVELSVPGQEIIADHDPKQHAEQMDPYLAVRDAFHHAERELRKYTAKVKAQLHHGR